jgi:protein SCO1
VKRETRLPGYPNDRSACAAAIWGRDTIFAVRPRYLILLVAATALALAAVVLAAQRAHREARALNGGGEVPATRFDGAELPPGVRAPSFSLRDQDGRVVTQRSLLGRPVVVTFLYTHCKETCPITAQQVKGALDDLRRPVPVIAISVDPPNDTPASARRFLARAGLTGRMHFLIGSRRELDPVWRGFAIAPQRPGREHQARVELLDARGMQRIGFPAQQATPERLSHDLRALGAS